MTDPPVGSAPSSRDPLAMLKTHVGTMGDLAISMVRDGTRALLDSDSEAGASVAARDAELDRLDNAIETETMRLIAVLQPEGQALRTLGAVLKIATCIDRVGRLGYDLAQYRTVGPDTSETIHRDLLRRMDEKARTMVAGAIDAFLRGDAPAAKAIFLLDDDVDELHDEVQRRLVGLLAQGGLSTERLAFELLAARHLERVADNACKIAEKAVYAITGERRGEYFPALAHRPGSSPPRS